MRTALRRGDVDVVVSYAVDRLSRNQNHIGVLFDEVEQAGAQLEFVTERFEDTAIGRFILAARGFIAEVEREKIVERTMRGKAERARSGRIPQATGRGIYGYHYDSATGRRALNEEQALVVLRIFEQFAAGGSILGITNALTTEGIPTYTGVKWSSWTVRNMLLNASYAGRTIYRRTKATYRRDTQTGKRRRVVEVRDQSEWIEIPDATPAIISVELFENAQARLRDPERRRVAQRKYDYPLTGIVRCDGCGSAMVGQTSLQTYRYYRCRRAYAGPRHDRCLTRYIRAAQLEEAVVREVVTLLSSPSLVLAELERASSSIGTNRELVSARGRLVSLERQRQRLLRLYQLGEIDDGYLERETATIRAQRASSEAVIERLSGAEAIRLPESPEAFAATCAAIRSQVLADVDDGQLDRIAKALQLSVRVQHTAEGASGVLEGVIPHSFDEDLSHHCTNIGITVQKRRNFGCAVRPDRGAGEVTARGGRPLPTTCDNLAPSTCDIRAERG